MVQARILQGRIEAQEPIPVEWEGQLVKITTMTPDDPILDLDERLALLHGMGAMEFEPGETETIATVMADLNEASKRSMESLTGHKP